MTLPFVALLLYVVAVVLVILDLFLPTGGLLSLLAAISAVASVMFAFRESANSGAIVLLMVLMTVPALVALAVRIWPKTPIGRRVILGGAEPPEESEAELREKQRIEGLLGSVITVDADLMPSGSARIGGVMANVIAESGYIEAGQNCELVAFRERQFILRPTTRSPREPEGSQSRSQDSDFGPTSLDAPSGEPVAEEGESLLDLPVEQFGLDAFDESDAPDDGASRGDNASR